ncbi:MAG TPA: lactate utilization protein C [Pseudonocardiaceae bacterium]|jgi:L-lactate dehydrogenase complex protein LldG|nr:lactate utilization protein C [Pseudonocardiaceae bacterium]
MADSRTDILARIDKALAGRPAPPPVPRDYERARDVGDLVALAAERIADYRANVHQVPAGDLVTGIGEILADRAPDTMIAPPGLPESWRATGIAWLVDRPSQPLTVPELDAAGGVLTGCALVIAETGTIVLDASPDQGRRALTLVPDYHLCVVRADQIVGTVPEAIERLDPRRPTTFISGPSATSDIEFDRVEGVHGPRTLDVVIAT